MIKFINNHKRISLFIINVCVLGLFIVHSSSARILDSKGKILREVVDVFRQYKPLIENQAEEIVHKGLPKERLEAILNQHKSRAGITLQELNDIAQVVFLRPPGKERKDLHSLSEKFRAYTNKHTFKLFRIIGDINPEYPKRKHYQYILFNGSTIQNMRQRLKTLVDLVKARKLIVTPKTTIVFLTGERDLFPEETKEQLMDPAPLKADHRWKQPAEFPLTEDQAAQWIWYQSDLPCALKEAKIVFVKAVKKSEVDPATQKTILKRPTTLDTVATWIKGHHPQPGHCLSISSQPYVYYQKATIYGAFQKAGLLTQGFSVDGAGVSDQGRTVASFKQNIAVYLDNFARTLYTELGNSKR